MSPRTPRSRIGTLLPLLGGTAKASIFALAFLTMLISIGVNVWPLITGLSVFGLAIGFGSQTLVKDIVSGLFFLVDDAFRLGEYVESSGAKGTVEKISIRSVSLRHARGALTTVPYGQIGKVVNFSRDWVIEKLVFRVAFDTDVDLVRKLFKKVGQEIADDPELNQDLLEPFKSQGIRRGDARRRRCRAAAPYRRRCRSAWSTGWRGRAVPGWCADRRRGRADAWRRNGAAHAASRCRAGRARQRIFCISRWMIAGLQRAARAPRNSRPSGSEIDTGRASRYSANRPSHDRQHRHDAGLAALAGDRSTRRGSGKLAAVRPSASEMRSPEP